MDPDAGLGEASLTAGGYSPHDPGGPSRIATLPITGERLVPGTIGGRLFRQHEVRYVFAGAFVKNKRVLDVASGSGIGTHYLLNAGAKSCIGLDIDTEAVKYAQAAYGGCIFTQCEATRLCLAEESVDAVVSFETIEHISDQKSFLHECWRVLRPGGIFVCSTPNRTLTRWGEKNRYHIQEFTVAEFKELITSVFTDVRLYAQDDSFYPLFAGRIVLSRLLNKMRLTRPIARVFGRESSSASGAAEFNGDWTHLSNEIELLRTRPLRQPAFVIAVAHKPLILRSQPAAEG